MLDRITGDIVSLSTLPIITSVIPQRYVNTRPFTYNRRFEVDAYTILFCDSTGHFVIDDADSVLCLDPAITSTISRSIEHIALQLALWLAEDELTPLPSPLVPEKVFEDTAKLNDFEQSLFDVLETGHLHQIAYQPRLDIRYDEELIDVSRAKKISNKAHRYLAVHSETWQRRTLAGVYPRKLLAKISDDNYSIYENKVFSRLLDRVMLFLQQRLRELEEQINNIDDALQLDKAHESYYKLTSLLCSLWASNLSDEKSAEKRKELMTISEKNLALQDNITRLQSFGLYLKIPQAHKNISNQLHKTNILMHDQHYRHVGILWTKLNKQSQEVKDLIKALEKKRQFQEEYNQYALLILLRALEELNFNTIKKTTGSILLANDELNWQVTIEVDQQTHNWRLTHTYSKNQLNIVSIANQIDDTLNHDIKSNTHLIVIHLLESKIDLSENKPFTNNAILANPLNFMATERLITRLLEWLYVDILTGYASDLPFNKISSRALQSLAETNSIYKNASSYQLINQLSINSKKEIESYLRHTDKASLLEKNQEVAVLKHCPLCHQLSTFEPRATNRTFIAQCLNSQCGVTYQLTSDADKNRYFKLNAKGEYKEAGRWNIKFSLE